MMLEDVYEKLCSKSVKGEWTKLDELRIIINDYCRNPKATENVMSFLKEYFLELDQNGDKARLNSWCLKLYKATT